jgi:putative tryptophan/tyrosine transport system substrate-binding protein
MKRRGFIAGLGSAAAWPLAARAQQGERVRRVGFLTYGSEAGGPPNPRLLRDDLEHLGWKEGRNLRLDFRFGDGDARKTSAFAADLVQLAPDVIVVAYTVALRALRQETKTIPIVIAGAGDILELGIVLHPAHPEGNATGFTNAFGSLGGKWLELLKEVAPNTTRVLFLTTTVRRDAGYLLSVETAAQSLGVQVITIPVSDIQGIKAAIEAFVAEPNGGLIPNPGTSPIVPFDELSRLAAQYRSPAIYGLPLPPGDGGLMSYSADGYELLRGAATYVDRLMRGARVSDLPLQYPTKFRLVINLKNSEGARSRGALLDPLPG